MRVLFSEDADADIEAIEARISIDNPARAITFVRELTRSAIAIGEAPFAYPLLGLRLEKRLRRKVFRPYLIVFRVRETEVEIVRILHGARDVDRILSSGEP